MPTGAPAGLEARRHVPAGCSRGGERAGRPGAAPGTSMSIAPSYWTRSILSAENAGAHEDVADLLLLGMRAPRQPHPDTCTSHAGAVVMFDPPVARE